MVKAMKLTKRSVNKIMPGEKDTFHWDDEFKGLGLKVTAAGKKIFVLQSRLHCCRSYFCIQILSLMAKGQFCHEFKFTSLHYKWNDSVLPKCARFVICEM